MNKKIKLTNNDKVKANIKMTGKVKRKFFRNYIETMEIINTISKIGPPCLNKRIKFVLASGADKEKQLKQIKDDHNQLKELIKWYDNGLIEEHHEKHDIFQRAFEMPYDENINRLEFVKREFDKYKTNEQNKYHIKSQRINNAQDWSQLTVSPVSTHDNVLSPLQIKHLNNPLLDKVFIRPKSESESPNSSICSTSSQSINCRINRWHRFDEKTVTNRVCSDCFSKVSLSRVPSKQVYKCKNCGIYIHESCRESNNRKLCIPLGKLPVKMCSERSVELKDLCQSQMQPMVPSVLLSLMHHIQTFGMKTKDLYRSTAREKDVKELCEKLIEGKSKFLAQCEIQTVASCLRFVLRGLKFPLLSNYIMKKLIKGNSDNLSSFSFTLRNCLDEMSQESMETFVYLMVHLKLIADNVECGLDGKGLASIFTPSMISSEMSSEYLTISIAVIEKLISMDHEFYKQYLPEDLFFHHAHAQLNVSSSSFMIRS